MDDYADEMDSKGFDSPMARKHRKEKKPEGEREGQKADFGRKGHRHKKRSHGRGSTRK
jgi:hypothetical protein